VGGDEISLYPLQWFEGGEYTQMDAMFAPHR